MDANMAQKQNVQNQMDAVDTSIQNDQINIENLKQKREDLQTQNLSEDQLKQEMDNIQTQIEAAQGQIKGKQMQKQQMSQQKRALQGPEQAAPQPAPQMPSVDENGLAQLQPVSSRDFNWK